MDTQTLRATGGSAVRNTFPIDGRTCTLCALSSVSVLRNSLRLKGAKI